MRGRRRDPGLTRADHPGPDVDNVVDGGTDCFSDHGGPVYVVVRNDYLSLRRALTVPPTTVGIVLITEPNRALGCRDVAEVLCWPTSQAASGRPCLIPNEGSAGTQPS